MEDDLDPDIDTDEEPVVVVEGEGTTDDEGDKVEDGLTEAVALSG